MHFYAIDFKSLNDLPLYTFWELAKNIDRIRAEEDKRTLTVTGTAFGGGAEKLFESLDKSQGRVIEFDATERFDRAGFERLMAKMTRC